MWSALYQYSFYQNPGWSSAMAPAPEIHKYLKVAGTILNFPPKVTDFKLGWQDAAARFGVSDRVSLNTRVKSAVWDEAAAEWVVR